MSRAIALIDGEHYPPVVRFALDELRREGEVVAAVFVGGTEKIDTQGAAAAYGVPVIGGGSALEALAAALASTGADEVVDLSDEPVLTSADRFRFASVALEHGASYRGADFAFTAPREQAVTHTPTLAVIGTGKRVGKTAISAYIARQLTAAGTDLAVLAMGRGGPAEPELIHGERVRLTTTDLLALAHTGVHAASDNYEDAVMARVTTIGCRRCGGGMAGETFFSNVPQGAVLADSLGKELLLLEGSGAAIPPVHADATILVIGADRGETYVRDYFGPYRLARADLVVLASAEEPLVDAAALQRLRAAIVEQRPDLPVVATTFRPAPIEPVAGRRVFFATTAPRRVIGGLVSHLEAEYGCQVVAVSTALSDRRRLRAELDLAAGTFDVLLTELKAAAIDVVAEAGARLGVPTVLCDNVPVAVDGSDLDARTASVAQLAIARGLRRRG
ncbi:MAG: 2,3-diphosphoglycerate synthetase [Coriobacteriia bacterium]|nr:2,3-diphosphoglycerate synthetase [Coriobacteriia bacterium]